MGIVVGDGGAVARVGSACGGAERRRGGDRAAQRRVHLVYHVSFAGWSDSVEETGSCRWQVWRNSRGWKVAATEEVRGGMYQCRRQR